VELYLQSPNIHSWCGAQLKHRANFTFYLYLLRQSYEYIFPLTNAVLFIASAPYSNCLMHWKFVKQQRWTYVAFTPWKPYNTVVLESVWINISLKMVLPYGLYDAVVYRFLPDGSRQLSSERFKVWILLCDRVQKQLKCRRRAVFRALAPYKGVSLMFTRLISSDVFTSRQM